MGAFRRWRWWTGAGWASIVALITVWVEVGIAMRIAVIGKGNVGGGLARRRRADGQGVQHALRGAVRPTRRGAGAPRHPVRGGPRGPRGHRATHPRRRIRADLPGGSGPGPLAGEPDRRDDGRRPGRARAVLL